MQVILKNQYFKAFSILLFGCIFSLVIINKTSAQSATTTPNQLSPKGSCSVVAIAVPNISEYEVAWNASFFNAPSSDTKYIWSGTDNLTGSTSLIRKRYTTPGLKTGTVTITSSNQSFTFDCSVNIPTAVSSTTSGSRIGGSCEPSSSGLSIFWNSYGSGPEAQAPFTYTWSGSDGFSTTTNPVYILYTSEGKKTGDVVLQSGVNSISLSCQAQVSSTSGCFIATATYGTEMESEVTTLRNFRDNVLLESSTGQDFVEFYYKVSPPVANVIRDNNLLKAIVRVGLEPIVYVLDKSGF